jgi:hypothetical protein
LSQPKPSALPTTFYRRRVKNEQLSKIESRDVFEDHAWVRVRNGADLLDHPVTQKDIDAAPLEYSAFLEGREPPGTPLSVLIAEAPDMMTQELADQLKSARGITTLEQVIAVADGSFTFGAGRALQRKAKETLERRAIEAVEQAVVRRDSKLEALEARLAALETENTKLRQLRAGES